uniref:NADH-ubiquinone oxidoreductase chain 6 n=1 Tax=Usechus lacerta TaxID=296008 RepID=A0A343A3T3_9CUCU|nr:NADH dehydrogenase subunit 6 [Usechus lacerta]AOY39211.1 NADH dehydrogenase subunit 6 [Usechus lacerta]
MTMMFMNLMMSMIFIMITHPLTLGFILMIQTILISMITGNFNYNFWYSYILFLILIGGMLILFIYMTSVASNEKFNYNMKMMLMIIMFLMMIIILPNMLNFEFNMYMLNNEMTMFNKKMFTNMSINKYMIYPSNMILMFMIMYLFITLIAIVKITNINKGPLRQNN